ncbi:MAG: TIGR02921 family PEP-CTERM protein [Cyanobacteria bacterium J06560_6]
MKRFIAIASHLIFWSWNLVFIGLINIWLLPEIGIALLQDARTGLIDPTLTVSLLALLIIPPLCTILGVWKLRSRPTLLMRLFFGVEAPLFTLCLLRLFLIRQLTPATAFTLGLLAFAMFMFTIELLSGYAARNSKLSWFQMIGHGVILLVGAWAGTLLLLYTVPASVSVLSGLGQSISWFFQNATLSGLFDGFIDILSHPAQSLMGLMMAFLVFSSIAIFLSMPYAFVHCYLQAWKRIRRAFGQQHGHNTSWITTGLTVAISCALFIGLQAKQPQVKAFSLLETTPSTEVSSGPLSSETIELRQQQLQNIDAIRDGLVNAYLHRYRYLSPWRSSNRLSEMYRLLGLREGGRDFLQTVHNGLLSPFLYQGKDNDVQKAEQLYEQFFDAPIQQLERVDIREALQATSNRDETQAGLLDLDQKVVYLASQEVSVQSKNDWGTITIHEHYENTTPDDQEIFYAFSLPESAAITGLWLSTAENPLLFPHVVSPRGAAQQVYNGEVERAQFQQAVDPALLEQVGPQQYRLRVFPIPGSTAIPDNRNVREPGTLDLTLTYQEMEQADVGWALPQLSEKRNIYWTEDTVRARGNRFAQVDEEDWMERAIAPRTGKSVTPKEHTVTFPEGYQVTATPLSAAQQQLPTDRRIAVVIDSSYSMGEHAKELQQAARQLKEAAQQNLIDFYTAVDGQGAATFNENASIEESIDVSDHQFYGSLQPADMLNQFAQAKSDTNYEAVLLLTDKGSYELNTDDAEYPALDASLWIVHLDEQMPTAYADNLLQLLESSQGGVDTTVLPVLQKIALPEAEGTILDGYKWKVTSVSPEASTTDVDGEDDAFTPIAARQLIRQQGRVLDTSQVSALDAVHAIAKRTSIVTPYSSMLVLVDERQRQLLAEAEASEDRFDREVEDGKNDLTDPGSPLTTASVPEPSQLLGVFIAAIALITLKRKSVRTQPPQI